MNRRQSFQPSCPLGGQWYVCETGSRFIGCCGNDPCSLGCKQGDLKPASFNPALHGKFPDLHCGSALFWTCNATSPPFMGCCKSNPCRGGRGCPTMDLAAAFLSINEREACQFYPRGCPPDSTPTSAPSSSSSTTVPQATTSRNSSTGPIVGGVVGGVLGFAMVLLLLFYCYRHSAKSQKLRTEVEARDGQQSMGSVPDTKVFSKANTHNQAYKPNTGHSSFPFSANDYSPPHTHSNSHAIRTSSPSPSELPSYGSPHLSQASPTQLDARPFTYELSAAPEAHMPASYKPALGLGLNVHPDRPQSYAPVASSPTTMTPMDAPRPLVSPTSPNLSELSAENGRHGSH